MTTSIAPSGVPIPLSRWSTGWSNRHWQELRAYASGIDGGQSVWIFDKEGNTVLESGHFPPRAVNVSDRAYFQSVKNGEQIFVGPALRSKVNNAVFYSVSRPILGENGEFLGIILAAMETHWLTDFYALMGFNLDPLVSVMRTDGTLVARRTDLEEFLGHSLANEQVLEEVRKGSEGFYDSVSVLDGKTRLAAYRKVGAYDLVVLTGVEKSVALQSWHDRSIRMVLMTTASAIVIIAAITLLVRLLWRQRVIQGALIDVMAEKEQVHAELSQARHDHLTGLPSRGLWLEQTENRRRRSPAEGTSMAVMLVDLDGFKAVNDTYGHDKGDEVLQAAANVLRGALRETDLAGRLGGDEFVVCAIGPHEAIQEHASAIARRVVERMESVGYGIGCSVGLSICPAHCTDLACALRRADEAMYEAKRRGKRRHVIWGTEKADGTAWEHAGCA
jgi:diguanylate cyclase (GGDEF)-like protein